MSDKIAEKLKKEGGKETETGEIKLKTEAYYIKYNPTTKTVAVGYITQKGHYALVKFYPRHLTVTVKIGEPPEKIRVRIRKRIRYDKLIHLILDEYKEIDEILRESGIELDI
jgi:hypothetical protein